MDEIASCLGFYNARWLHSTLDVDDCVQAYRTNPA